MANRKFEEEAQYVGKAIGRRHLAWVYLFIAVLTGALAIVGWDPAVAGLCIFLGLVSVGALAWAVVSAFPKRLRNLRCPCCGGDIVFKPRNGGALHMACKKCGQNSHLGLSQGGSFE